MPNHPTPRPHEMLLFGLRPQEGEAKPTHLVYAGPDRLLSQPECAEIIATGEAKGWTFGAVGNGNNNEFREDPDYRSVKVCALEPTDLSPSGQDLRWLYAKLAQRVVWANQRFNFHLAGFAESVQLLKYEAHPEGGRPPGHYRMHQDYGGGYSSLRKLSVVVQLSDPSEYEGCRLHLLDHMDREIGEVGQGDTIIFPSYTPHYVTPITSGVRYALALWVSGPPFA